MQNTQKTYPKLVAGMALFLSSLGANAAVVDAAGLADVAANIDPAIEHCDDAVALHDFMAAFLCGDELFETRFNALDGVGMDVGDGGRFTRVPRADLVNWSSTTPGRATGPNAEACNVCHTTETLGNAGDGAGPIGLNAIRDPLLTGSPGSFIQRNTPHLFGMAGPQLLAEEMTTELQAIYQDTLTQACATQTTLVGSLTSKGIDFGTVEVIPKQNKCLTKAKITLNNEGIADDLIVRPFQWKGSELNIRNFSRGAFHNELGMNPVELAGDNFDGDFDGVVNEISIADVTAMAVYLAGQPRPTSLLELNNLRHRLKTDFGAAGEEEADRLGIPPSMGPVTRARIVNGREIFTDIGCASCHQPKMRVDNPTFNEPSLNANFREEVFPAGQNAAASGVDPTNPLSFDITEDIPDNIISVNGTFVKNLGAFERNNQGQAVIRLYGDLKLHDMGPALAENIDETGAGASVWMTKELWGLAQTAPYLHDGRATTIEEAIIEHGGEAAASQANFAAMSNADQDDVLLFLNNLILFFAPE